MKNRFLSGIAAAFVAFAPLPALAADPTPVAATEARPAMWRVADEDTTIYLFGTIHILPQGVDWRTDVMDAALAASDELVLEAIIDDDPSAAGMLFARMGMQPGLPPLLERVPEEKRPALQAMIAGSGVPMQVLDQMKSWTAALILVATRFQQMGLQMDQGAEKVLNAAFAEGRPVIGLETMEQQLGFFDGLSEEAQRAFLEGVADDPEAITQQFQEMMEAWRTGNVDAIAETFDSELTMSEELREVLMRERNRNWTRWLVERMARPGTAFVAVGAGHLAGEDRVQAMLEAEGLTVERVQ